VNTPTPQPSSPLPPFTSDDKNENGVADELEQIQNVNLGGYNPNEA